MAVHYVHHVHHVHQVHNDSNSKSHAHPHPRRHRCARASRLCGAAACHPACLIDIQDWDFNWQGAYRYREPIAIPTGTQFLLTAYYDNSSSNPRNPNDPPKAVSWGEETTDEMCIAFLGLTLD